MLRFLLGVMDALYVAMAKVCFRIRVIEERNSPSPLPELEEEPFHEPQFSWEELSAMEDKAQAEYDAKKAADPFYPRRKEAEMMHWDPVKGWVVKNV